MEATGGGHVNFDKALKFVQARQAAHRDIQDLQGAREHAKWNRASGSVYNVNNVHAKSQQDTGTCYRGNGDNHLAKDCRFAQEKCFE